MYAIREARLAPVLPFIVLLGCAPVPAELARPNRVALDAAGQVYVSDFHHDRIVVFDAEGRFVRTFGSQGIGDDQLWRVTAMSVARDGTLLVANRRPESDDLGSATRVELKRFDDGREVGRVLLDGRTLQTDGWIDGIAESPTGTWIIADTTHGELVEVDTEGRRVGRFGGISRPDAAPSAVVRDGDSLWVVEQNRHRISRLAPHGDERALELRDAGHRPPRFPSAMGVCHHPNGDWIAIADFGNHRLQRYDLDGNWVGEFAPEPVGIDQPVQLMDVAVSADCSRLYLVDSKGNRVLVTTPEGEVLQTLASW